ncbi:transcriptional regulator [Xaviernesmea oryzae]|uniref:Transcriptional regulator n=1 Tax=Xaviernesmea oryzae TaxID=464029 RepID=A0A1Q9B3K7_9HYPH|nr:helix-turn-helix transcriptional regulator [Xaviernesmea oryzae]OLP62629.1 transcriptional regulator [Xaviernesmea oryzae]SEM25453.1 Helix-turn-helix [Xaviernesmea oryzae]
MAGDNVLNGIDIRRVTIDGKAYVQIGEEDFEDLIDGLQADVILARIAAGEETWPHELVVELMNTDSPIRTYRTYRNLTVSELAAAAGISQPYLSEIEAGKKTGSVDVLKRIAGVLKVDLDDLVVERDAHQ